MKLWNLEKQATYILIYTHKKEKHQRALDIVLINKYGSIWISYAVLCQLQV